MGIFSKIFGAKADIGALIEQGAVRIDVRTKREFKAGHADGWRNIPGNELDQHLAVLKKENKPIVLCCASGIRSGAAAATLRKQGIDAHNAGGWAKWK